MKIEEKIATSNAELLFEVCKIRVRSYAELPFDVLRNHCSKSRGITVRGGAEYAGVNVYFGFVDLFLILSSRFRSFSNWILAGSCLLYLLIAYLASEGYRFLAIKDARRLQDVVRAQLQELNQQLRNNSWRVEKSSLSG